MPSFHRILVPVDFSTESLYAVTQAFAMARSTGVRLALLHVHPYSTFAELGTVVPPMPSPSEELRAMLLHQLAAFVAPAHAEPDPVEMAVRGGDPVDQILAHAGEHGVDLVVLAMRGRPGSERWGPGAVTERVVREGRPSVLVLRLPDEHRALAPLTGILCAVDLSETSVRTLGVAAGIANDMRLPLTVLHVVESEGWANREQQLQEAHEHLAALLSRYKEADTWIEALIPEGRAREEIVRLASSRESELLVLGAPPKWHSGSPFLGATAQHVLHYAPVSILLARTPSVATRTSGDREKEASHAVQ